LRHDREKASILLTESAAFSVEEPEPHQHRLLTEAWLHRESDETAHAIAKIESAMATFPDRRRVGDHTVHLLARLSRYEWPEAAARTIDSWRRALRHPLHSTPPASVR
jgi:hypothetical protein